MREIQPPPEVTEREFASWRTARRGTGQAEVLTNSFWSWMVETGYGPYRVNEYFGGHPSTEAGPGWTNQRYGQSTTELPDGRTVLIAGEHEDYYDPDFFIYNDLIVRHASGEIEIYGYGDDIFPPTDFHSATLVDNTIVVIGNLGYADRRHVGETQVLTIDTGTWKVQSVGTTGQKPGWISDHKTTKAGIGLHLSGGTVLVGEGRGTLIENTDDWELDVGSWTWRRVTDRGWQQWQLARSDAGPSGLWQRRVGLLTSRGTAAIDPQLDGLYAPPIQHNPRNVVPGEFNVHRIDVDGVTVRYVEDMGGVRMVVEGSLSISTIEMLADDLRTKLSELEAHPYDAERLA